MIEAFFGLFGVVLGFVLSVGYQELKALKERRSIYAALLAELRSNLLMIPYKRKIIEQVIKNLSLERLLSGESVRFQTLVYDANCLKMSSICSQRERDSLHFIYQHLNILDSTLASYSLQISDALKSERQQEIFGIQISRFRDLANVLPRVEKLISGHIKGVPIDVLQSNQL